MSRGVDRYVVENRIEHAALQPFQACLRSFDQPDRAIRFREHPVTVVRQCLTPGRLIFFPRSPRLPVRKPVEIAWEQPQPPRPDLRSSQSPGHPTAESFAAVRAANARPTASASRGARPDRRAGIEKCRGGVAAPARYNVPRVISTTAMGGPVSGPPVPRRRPPTVRPPAGRLPERG